MKRAVDLLLSITGTLVIGPLLLGLAMLIFVSAGWPVFYRQERVGRGGRRFKIWKFRTMVRNAEKQGLPLTVDNDPRITFVGRWIRKTKLDELPQLLNVVVGEMSLVGPRPEVPNYVAKYNDYQRQVLQLTPGITDPASIRFFQENELLSEAESPEETYLREIMPEKIRLNLEYARQADLRSDLGVILKTFKRMVA
jgi:lipopolysaccharide/colanic/teichoic acid biosynthesis glycosyltransferase